MNHLHKVTMPDSLITFMVSVLQRYLMEVSTHALASWTIEPKVHVVPAKVVSTKDS